MVFMAAFTFFRAAQYASILESQNIGGLTLSSLLLDKLASNTSAPSGTGDRVHQDTLIER